MPGAQLGSAEVLRGQPRWIKQLASQDSTLLGAGASATLGSRTFVGSLCAIISGEGGTGNSGCTAAGARFGSSDDSHATLRHATSRVECNATLTSLIVREAKR